jgi:hypothetical protein
MCFVSEIETMSLTGVVQWCSTIDEKHSVFNVVFLAEFGKERVSENVFLVGSSFIWSNPFVSGSTPVYSQ